MHKLTLHLTVNTNNPTKPYGYDAEQNGYRHHGRRRWKSEQARDAEVQKIAKDWRARGWQVEVSA